MGNYHKLPDWRQETVAILGGGPSLTRGQVDYCRGKCRVIAINRAIELAPWADWLHGSDRQFWDWYPEALDFPGLKTTYQQAVDPRVLELKMLAKNDRAAPFSDPTRPIHAGRDSGYQAIQLASYCGAALVILLGFDFRANGHWHDGYPTTKRVRRQPNYIDKTLPFHERLAPLLSARGTTVVNCSPGSVLAVYGPLAGLEDVLLARAA